MKKKALTHFDKAGNAHMVDVGDKSATKRRAVARATVNTTAQVTAAIADGSMKKGDVLAVARIAGIQAAKRTSDLIPLCHQLNLSSVSVDFDIEKKKNAIFNLRLVNDQGKEIGAEDLQKSFDMLTSMFDTQTITQLPPAILVKNIIVLTQIAADKYHGKFARTF